ncbi:AAA family ATPase [Corallincola spongiicola]|uniref:AAA family ATPase n=1 Tax=Corallincola spongiicola TaxID=2520508 RepID=A0ABY1WT97_9GAMM|nr:AAA family ATPase [Corallincola spongiicola]
MSGWPNCFDSTQGVHRVQDKNLDKQGAEAGIVDKAVTEGGAYEVIRKRLEGQGKQLREEVDALNQSRISEFGSTEMKVLGRLRTRTENNCIAQDIVCVGEHLLFGFNVFMGLKKETHISDVFALYHFQKTADGFDLEPARSDDTFLANAAFVREFNELYAYYKNTRLSQLVVKDGKLLASFQIGEREEDIRVFRWSISADGKRVEYIDNRGERDIALPSAYDFEWQATSRENAVHGKHPHLNILDTLFVETVGGDLTVKIEDNTASGEGIYAEAVVDQTQSLDDADVFYAEVGHLILLKILPYREETWRYLLFNKLTHEVLRVDAIGQACRLLPENHGIIFPGGIYLESGGLKLFDEDMTGMRFRRVRRSPNGEDAMYVFYNPENATIALFAYNLIEKSLQVPLLGHGYAMLDDGTMVIFYAEGDEPTRVHPMQVWETPYCSDEHASKAPVKDSVYGRIGNAELVRAISDFYSVCRAVDEQSVSARLYDELCKNTLRLFDSYYWLDNQEVQGISDLLHEIAKTSELVLDEFEKVESIRQQSELAMAEAEQQQKALLKSMNVDSWHSAEAFVDALDSIRKLRGHLLTIRDYRYINTPRIDEMEQQLQETGDKISLKTGEFLSSAEAIAPYHDRLGTLEQALADANSIVELEAPVAGLEKMASELDLLSELMTSLKVDDAQQRTAIVEAISEVYAKLNQSRARAGHKQKELGSAEAVAEFSASFKLFSQGITNALSAATTPEKCDEQLTRLLVQLEELESQFSEHDEFLADILSKREEVYESFEAQKQALLDERQRKAQNLQDAASRILSNIQKRVQRFTEPDELNSFYAADPLVMKVREISEQLRGLDDQVKADDIDARFKMGKDQALKSLRDKSEIYEEGGNVIKLGPRHKFSVNTQPLDITILPRNNQLNFHLTGTDYFEPVEDKRLAELSQYWQADIESESAEIYRAEYLAGLILDSADMHEHGLTPELLSSAASEQEALVKIAREFAAPRYKEGYQKGVHDHDAALILAKVLPLRQSVGLLRFDPLSRGLAIIFWANNQQQAWAKSCPQRARSALTMQTLFASGEALVLLEQELLSQLNTYLELHTIPVSQSDCQRAVSYLVRELANDRVEFETSKYARQLADELKQSLKAGKALRTFEEALQQLVGKAGERWALTHSWLTAMLASKKAGAADTAEALAAYVPEAVAIINAEERVSRRHSEADLNFSVDGLLGEHSRIDSQSLQLRLDSFLTNYQQHRDQFVPAYHEYLNTRQQVISDRRKQLKLHEFVSRPLSSFVRNQLINQVYLPIIGDNLAKQMGTVGENKRTDLMGLLMMISPPGYGKTTLMEYVANRLGLIFMKINCPSLGHEVDSLDPTQAPNATAKQELEKLNLALEMGNNVMLYLDDIQHTHPEFLQKFISLCDGTRRIEGVWRNESKTYDMRGKKFCVVMAGNPYTESGEVFKIPDMLANRADIYNLGEVLGGMEAPFALSYIENSLTSNQVLQPLATRDMQDLYRFAKMVETDTINTNDLSHSYSGAEVNEILDVLRKLMVVRDVLLKVNKQYIVSASQAEKYRTEPAFKLQGSYRNMNKMAEKISAVMNDAELKQVIADHYLGEAQLLTGGAEENLLKLGEMRGTHTDAEAARWQQIKADFARSKAMGGDDADTGMQVVGQLHDLVSSVKGAAELMVNKPEVADSGSEQTSQAIVQLSKELSQAQQAASDRHIEVVEAQHSASRAKFNKSARAFLTLSKVFAKALSRVEVVNQPIPGLENQLATLTQSLQIIAHSLAPDDNDQIQILLRNIGKLEHELAALKGGKQSAEDA